MPLRKGDTVSLSISPAVHLTRYQLLKTHATLTRVLGDDPEADMADAQSELRRIYFTTVHAELTLLDELSQIISNDGTTEAVANYAAKQARINVSKASEASRPPRAKRVR